MSTKNRDPAGPSAVQGGGQPDGAVRAIARSGSVNIFASGVAAIANFVLVVLITQLWTIQTAGLIFAISSIFLICVALSQLGVHKGLVRFLAWNVALEREDRNRKIVIWGVLVTVLTSTMVLAAGIIFASPLASVLSSSGETGEITSMVRIFAIAVPIATAYEITLAISRGYGLMRPTILIERLIRPVLQVVLVALAGMLSASAGWLAGVWVAPYAVGLGVALFCLPKRHGASAPDPALESGTTGRTSDIREFWKFTIPRGLARLAQVGLQRADVAIVTILAGPGAGAIYTAATRFLVIGQLAVTAIDQVSEPQLARLLAKRDIAAVKVVARQLTLWIVTLVWPVYFMIIAYAEYLLVSIFGPEYASGALVLQILAVAMLLATAMGPGDVILIMAGHSSLSLLNMVGALVIDVVLCVLLIPRLGILGAAISWAVAIILRNLLCYAQVQKLLQIVPISRPILAIGAPLFLIGLINLAATTWFGLKAPAVLIIIAASGIGYLAVVWAAREPLALSSLHRRRTATPSARAKQLD